MRRRRFITAAAGATLGTGLLGFGRMTRAFAGGEGEGGRGGAPGARLLLRGAVVFDGSGAPGREADVLVSGDRVLQIGRDLPAAGAEVVELHGLALAPGFIDIHSHADLSLFVNPRAESRVRQGVTTEIVGQDGSSIGPWSPERAERIRRDYRERYRIDIDLRELPDFFRRFEREGAAVNLASMVGAGAIREYVVGHEDTRADAAQLRAMTELVEAALAAGACGLSSGLEYTPGAFADAAELGALAAPLSRHGLPYATHMRNEDDRLLAAIEEAIDIGRRSGAPVHISHLKAQGRRNWWKAGPALALMEAARDAGTDVTFDCYPYIAYSTGLANLFPVSARDGGTEAFLRRLRDPSLRPALEGSVRDKIDLLGSWDAVQVTRTHSDDLAWARGRRLGELAAERGEEPYELLVRLIVEDANRAGMVGFGMDEDDVARFLAHPLSMVCSDGGAFAPYGPLSQSVPHPRAYGAFPRVLGHFVRDRADLPLETAIRKMTGAPAKRLRIEGRGTIAAGAFADLVAFDPLAVADRATFEDPHRYPTGIPHVLVNGRFVIRDGEHSGELPGRIVAAPARAD